MQMKQIVDGLSRYKVAIGDCHEQMFTYSSIYTYLISGFILYLSYTGLLLGKYYEYRKSNIREYILEIKALLVSNNLIKIPNNS